MQAAILWRDFAALLCLLAPLGQGRMGSPSRVGIGHSQNRSKDGGPPGGAFHGYQFYASTTVYGDTPKTSCGSIDTRDLVKETGYYAVASAQAMQSTFAQVYGGCTWECRNADGTLVDRCTFVQRENGTLAGSQPLNGCSCRQIGSCMCGKAGNGTGTRSGVAAMGCFTCGKGRFLHGNPYTMNEPGSQDLWGDEVKVVVADVCPYGPNYMWCPAVAGERNAAGMVNHFDFATRPPQPTYNNNFFVFTPEPCPAVIVRRMWMNSTCPALAWPGA